MRIHSKIQFGAIMFFHKHACILTSSLQLKMGKLTLKRKQSLMYTHACIHVYEIGQKYLKLIHIPLKYKRIPEFPLQDLYHDYNIFLKLYAL